MSLRNGNVDLVCGLMRISEIRLPNKLEQFFIESNHKVKFKSLFLQKKS